MFSKNCGLRRKEDKQLPAPQEQKEVKLEKIDIIIIESKHRIQMHKQNLGDRVLNERRSF